MQVYFQADAETGNLTQWNHDNGGGVYYGPDGGMLCGPLDKNTAGVLASKDVVHSGQYSFKFLLADPAKANHAKLMRWRIDKKEAYYSGWYWFDKNFQSRTGGVNVLQWKTLPGEADGSCEPTIVIECITHVDGIRQLRAYHWSVGQKKVPFRTPTVLTGTLIGEAMYMPGIRADPGQHLGARRGVLP